MIKLTYADLNNTDLNTALNRLSRETGFSNFKACLNVSKILRKLTEELQEARDLNQKLLVDFCEKDAEGKTKFDNKTGLPVFIDDEKKTAYLEKHKEFLKEEFQIDCPKIKIEDLGSIKMSPHDINSLEAVLEIELDKSEENVQE